MDKLATYIHDVRTRMTLQQFMALIALALIALVAATGGRLPS